MGVDSVRDCYDELAVAYHFMFEDWEASIARQSAVLGPLLVRECGAAHSARILDCACGIGTQALGLAQYGFSMTGADLSSGAVERARHEASARGLDLPVYMADMRDLSGIPASGFDAVICMDNALPHLGSDDDLACAASQIRGKLRSGGGTFAASIRDYDQLIETRPVVHGPAFFSSDGSRRIVLQMWDWMDDRRYTFHLYITRQTPAGWETQHHTAVYRAVRRDELNRILEVAGFGNVRWLMPEESGFYQPIVLAKA